MRYFFPINFGSGMLDRFAITVSNKTSQHVLRIILPKRSSRFHHNHNKNVYQMHAKYASRIYKQVATERN